MLGLRRTILALAGIITFGGAWYFWPGNGATPLVTGPISVSYDARAMRLTAVVNIQNSDERPIVASITNAVFVDSRKQMSDASRPQTRQMELMPRQPTPVIFLLEGETAADVWRGVQLMEVTITADYRQSAQLDCAFSFMGRFYPEIKKMGTVSSTTSPRECGSR